MQGQHLEQQGHRACAGHLWNWSARPRRLWPAALKVHRSGLQPCRHQLWVPCHPSPPLPMVPRPAVRTPPPQLSKALSPGLSFHFITPEAESLPQKSHHKLTTWLGQVTKLIGGMFSPFKWVVIHLYIYPSIRQVFTDIHMGQALPWQISQTLWSSEKMCMKLHKSKKYFYPKRGHKCL